MLKSFDAPLNVLIIGANGGLGSAFCEVLRGQPEIAELVTMARSDAKGAVDILCDITDEAALQNAAHRLEAHGPFHLIINATGLLHDRAHGLAPEKSLAQIDATAMARDAIFSNRQRDSRSVPGGVVCPSDFHLAVSSRGSGNRFRVLGTTEKRRKSGVGPQNRTKFSRDSRSMS